MGKTRRALSIISAGVSPRQASAGALQFSALAASRRRTTERKTAHRTGTRRVLYSWHPWSVRLVRVRDVVEKVGTARARCAVDEAARAAGRKFRSEHSTAWPARVCGLNRAPGWISPRCPSWHRLCQRHWVKPRPPCAGWLSNSQDLGETHARSTQGASKVPEGIGATRSARPAERRRPRRHAGVALAAEPDTPEYVRADGPTDAGPRARSPPSRTGRSSSRCLRRSGRSICTARRCSMSRNPRFIRSCTTA